ncbi:hypothetical protein SELMODRAFT_186869 [Selaginella moellendorffii]|uniref:Uncharacterized protein n=1 Tax=Selaginella moellendorffii TaxID=88036 RepID=D8TAG2_SELML|nr:hypothetical protein SELMODRAFT_186869 [Selaginella moellendorffii]
MEGIGKAVWTGALLVLLALVAKLWRSIVTRYWLEPRSLDTRIRSQGIQGPPRTFLAGNMLQVMKMRDTPKERDMAGLNHDIVEHVLLDYHQWSKEYGKMYFYWWATEPRIMVTEPELIREVLAKKVTQFEKSDMMVSAIASIIGRGLIAVNGDEWSHHRRVVAPAFYLEKLKKMVPRIGLCALEMLDRWEEALREQPEIEMSSEFSKLTADIISHTAFGSSYLKGQKVFETLRAIQEELSKVDRYNYVPGKSMNPFSELNRAIRNGQKKVDNLLLEIVHARQQLKDSGASSNYGSDLLGLMLDEVDSSRSFSGSGIKPELAFTSESLIEECKTFYVAGHETTAKLITWAMMLLATNPTWQERARAEVLEVCKSGVPDSEAASKLKIVGMVLNETLRLYPPAVFLVRTAMEDTKLGNLMVPEGTGVLVPILSILHDKEVWGEDANEFNPQRFADGVANASKHPFAFLPFSHGPRVCLGQGFALMEAKVALTMILHRFSFEISPSYQHSPVLRLTLTPKHGMPLLLSRRGV